MTIKFEGKDYDEKEFLSLYIQAKTKENDAKEIRTNMEMALLEKYGDQIDEDKAAKSIKEGRFTITIKRAIRYDLTEKGWQIVMQLPEVERPVDIKYNHTKGKEIPNVFMEEVVHETKPSFTVVYK